MSEQQQPNVQRHTLTSLMAAVRSEPRAHLKCRKCNVVYLAKEAKSKCPECGGDGEPQIIE